MIHTDCLPLTIPTCDEMRAISSDWEKKASVASEEPTHLSKKQLLAVKIVCEQAFYRFHHHRLTPNQFVVIAYNEKLDMLGFSLVKEIQLTHKFSTESYRVLFVHLMSGNPTYLKQPGRCRGIGKSMIDALKIECHKRHAVGMYSEPTYDAMRFFHKLGFIDTVLERTGSKRRGSFFNLYPHLALTSGW